MAILNDVVNIDDSSSESESDDDLLNTMSARECDGTDDI